MNARTRIIAGSLVALAAAGAGADALVDDLEAGHSINRFGGMWSFSGDFWDKGDSKILSAVDTSVAIPFFKGAYGGGYPDGTGNAAKLHFRFGLTKPGTPPDTYDNNVNMTCPFGADDAVANLQGAISISFRARSDKDLQVEVVLPTLNITDWAYYSSTVAVGTQWKKYTFKLAEGAGGFTRRPFGSAKPFDLTQAQGIQWELNKGKNASITEATLWVDDVSIEGWTYVPAEPRGSCAPKGCIVAAGVAPSPSALLSDFEGTDPTRNVLGLSWSYFSSVPMQDVRSNELTGGIDSATFGLDTRGKGYGGSNGAWLQFGLGQTWFTPEGYLMLPTVSLTNMVTWDTSLAATGSTGLSFDFMTSGDVEYIDLKVKTAQIHADNIYAVAYVKVKGTGGQWKGAQVKWSDFVLPNWGPAFREAEQTMVFDQLVSLEWSVSSAKADAKGTIAVDNVRLLGLAQLPDPPVSLARPARGHAPAPGVRIRRGRVELPDAVAPGILRIDGKTLRHR